MFTISFTNRSEKDIQKLDVSMNLRIKAKCEKLREDPFPSEVERVEGYKHEKVFRVRVGDYRILYIVIFEVKHIIIVKVDKRSRIYNH